MVSEMWILWKMRFWRCVFWEKCAFEIENLNNWDFAPVCLSKAAANFKVISQVIWEGVKYSSAFKATRPNIDLGSEGRAKQTKEIILLMSHTKLHSLDVWGFELCALQLQLLISHQRDQFLNEVILILCKSCIQQTYYCIFHALKNSFHIW